MSEWKSCLWMIGCHFCESLGWNKLNVVQFHFSFSFFFLSTTNVQIRMDSYRQQDRKNAQGFSILFRQQIVYSNFRFSTISVHVSDFSINRNQNINRPEITRNRTHTQTQNVTKRQNKANLTIRLEKNG